VLLVAFVRLLVGNDLRTLLGGVLSGDAFHKLDFVYMNRKSLLVHYSLLFYFILHMIANKMTFVNPTE
jgi:hypothetical protein